MFQNFLVPSFFMNRRLGVGGGITVSPKYFCLTGPKEKTSQGNHSVFQKKSGV